jgi:cyclic beta-1,2-glucan synthetase
VEWTLGTSRAATAPFIVTEHCATTGALLARNPWNTDFAERVAFLDMAGAQSSATADRREFLGPEGSMDSPAALRTGAPLALRVGAGIDPCAALLTRVELPADGVLEIAVFLGQAADRPSATAMIGACRAWDLEQQWQLLAQHWDAVLGTVQVSTPDRSLDLLLNRWVLYQTLSCRMWARAAFYQASGAYGFRDQLQDGMALVIAAPQITRAHLLRAAGRQFPEGDVQHWWMPENGRGVRTRISDDRVWLAYCVAQYIQATGDSGLLDERVPFLAGDPLEPGALERYFEPGIEPSEASLFEHCARALDTSLALGEHGLPLIGAGDWNDGFNAVGAAGRGESVWLGWFLYATLESFAALAAARGDGTHVERWRAHAATLRTQLEQSGWDGDWYRRGYFDDGTPLGSAANAECRIDSIAQSWAVLSGAATPGRWRLSTAT